MRLGAAALGVIAALIGSILATPVFGADSGQISATVTAVAPCITLASTTLPFPSAKFSSTSAANSLSSAAMPALTSCATVPENILGSATNATGAGPVNWTLVAPATTGSHCTTGGALTPNNKFALNHFGGVGDERFLNNAATSVKTGLAAAGSMTGYSFDLFMPCTGSDGAGVQMAFTINFTAVIPYP